MTAMNHYFKVCKPNGGRKGKNAEKDKGEIDKYSN
jgi:hypothetical protein